MKIMKPNKKINLCVIGGEGALKVFSDINDLLKYSLQNLGYETQISSSNIINDENYINILIGGHLLPVEHLSIIPENTIFLNTEQLDSLSVSEKSLYIEWYERIIFAARRFETWDYSTRNIEHFNRKLGIKVKYLRLGFQKELKRIVNKSNKDIDILFYGSINQRRAEILSQLQNMGLNVVSLLNVYGKERDDYISRAKIVLNLHYFNAEIFEIVRCFYLMSNEIAVVSEINPNTQIESYYRNGVYGVPYEKLVQTCIELLQNEEKLDQLRFDSLNTIMQLSQEKIMQEILVR